MLEMFPDWLQPLLLVLFIDVVLAGDKEGSDFEQAAKLKTRLGERLPAYMVPRKFHFLASFPMNDNGKADRRKLAELLG